MSSQNIKSSCTYSVDSQFQLTSQFEGCSLVPYRDSLGNWTVGYGRNLTDKGLSREEATLLCKNDISEALHSAKSYAFFDSLNTPRKMVVVDMIFNMGPNRFAGFIELVKALNHKDYESAAIAMTNSRWFGQVKSRAVRLVEIMKSGEVNIARQ